MLPTLLWNSQRTRDETGQSARERSEKGFPLRSVETRLPRRTARHDAAALKCLESVGPTKHLTIVAATPGCRELIILRLSAQLAQWAETRILVVFRKPHPPIWNGKLAQSCVSPTPEMPKSCVKHRHVATSCASANCSVSAGGIPRREYVARVLAQKRRSKPSTLKVLDQRNPIEESAVFLCGGPEFGLHILLVANRDAQHTDPLL